MDITSTEVKDNAKREVLEKINGILQDAGLFGYELNLRKAPKVIAAPNIQLFQTSHSIKQQILSES